MSVTVRWTQRVSGRHVGDVETVERTPFIDGVIAAGRVIVLEEAAPVAEDKPKPMRLPKANMTIEVDPSAYTTTNEAGDDGAAGPVS